ncbi:FMRFamide receptor [Aplysia californica]|uniref:FMRFamide receptor n=1 Tax=Aplysia californica TaxID=6500 RepID=A0ABM1AAT6_APLCA|nr:FMRFamide receptor [Aplysia californica]XP_005091022.1 FMRFamide receptor [Aplysia californica]XP_012944143.1 FMRFamide receptor [Aplysia californica]XP_012944146.1 FMRFamide receptor [Aplysia californica]
MSMMNEINLKVNVSYGDSSINDETSEETTLILFIFWGIFLPMIALVGLVGNILTIIVLWRREMHSTTILYLRGLVLTDTGILIGSVITLTPISCANYLRGDLDFFKDRVYPMYYSPGYYIIMALQQANVWITVSVSMERYIAICHPFRAARLITRRKTILVMVVIVVVSLLYNIPHLLATHATECQYGAAEAAEDVATTAGSVTADGVFSSATFAPSSDVPDTTTSDVLISGVMDNSGSQAMSSITPTAGPSGNLESSTHSPELPPRPICYQVSTTEFGATEFYKFYRTIMYTVVIYVIPFLALVFLNSFLIKELMNMQRRRSGTNMHDENEANLSMVLVLIVIVFILCQTPGLISQFDVISIKVFFIWLAVSNVLFTTNSAVNFLIYTAFGRKFRSVLLRLFRRFYHGGRRQSMCNYRTTQVTNDYDPSNMNDTQYSSIRSNKSQGKNGGTPAGGTNGVHENLQLNNLSRSNNNENNGNGVVGNGNVQGGMGSLKRSDLSPTPELEEDSEDVRINERSPLTYHSGSQEVIKNENVAENDEFVNMDGVDIPSFDDNGGVNSIQEKTKFGDSKGESNDSVK